MANLPSLPIWAETYQLEITDPVVAGANGITNTPLKQLNNRTQWLRDKIDGNGSKIGSFNQSVNCVLSNSSSYSIDGQAADANSFQYYAGSLYWVTTTDTNVGGLYFVTNPGSLLAVGQTMTVVYGGGSASSILLFPAAGTTLYNQLDGSIANLRLFPGDIVTFVYRTGGWRVLRINRYSTDNFVQPAQVSFFARNTPPAGWLAANGAAVSRATYADLFAAIGTTFGAGNGTSTFNLPDLRGEFLRGWDNGRGVDTGTVVLAATTTNTTTNVSVASTAQLAVGMSVSGTGIPVGATIASITSATVFVLSVAATATGGPTLTFTGRQLGSWQVATYIQTHVGTIGSQLAVPAGDTDSTETYNIGGQTDTTQGSSQSWTRNRVRPRNVALLACIKF